MKTRLMYLVSFFFIAFLVGQVQAQSATWVAPEFSDYQWNTSENWSEFPTLDHWAKVRNGLPGPTVPVGVDAQTRRLHIGYSEGGALTVDGGTVVVAEDDLLLGKNGGEGILNMIGGSIDVARDFEVGAGNPGTVNMTGGTITVADDFEIPETEGDPDSPATVHLDGGTIIIGGDLHMFEHGLLDITAGTLILDGNAVSTVQASIDNGWISAYDGDGSIHMDYDITSEGQTTITAEHKFMPYPGDGSIVAPGAVALTWVLPDPVTAGEQVQVDVYITDDLNELLAFNDPASMQVVSASSVTSANVQTAAKTRYYWAVDTYVGDPNDPILGPVFSFLAGNTPPAVAAADDVTSWLDNGSADVAISAAVEDDDPTTVLWTVLSEPDDPNSPDAVIVDPTALDTSVTLRAVGEYVLQLEADDGDQTGADVLTINVFSDSCAAAQSLPDYVPLAGDLDQDCDVDQDDLDILMADWLNCVALGECTPNDPDGQ
jgi:hypothetical protein